MSADWDDEEEEGSDDPAPIPKHYYNILFSDASWDRISIVAGEKIITALKNEEKLIFFMSLVGGSNVVVSSRIVGLIESTESIRKKDRDIARWLRKEAYDDKYLKSFSGNRDGS